MSWQARYLTGMCALMLGLFWYGFHRNGDPQPAGPDEDKRSNTTHEEAGKPNAPLPGVSDTPFLNTGSDAEYIGSKKCIECHADQAETYFHTSHSRSMSLAKGSTLTNTSVNHADSGFAYHSETHDGQITQTESVLVNGAVLEDTRRSEDVAFVVGSGQFGHSFLFDIDGFFVQSPLTWYTTRDCWDMSPGYNTSVQRSFRRAVSAGCLYCHAGAVEIHGDNEYDVTVRETAIGCERCHGPGSLHVARHKNWTVDTPPLDTIDYTIVNPAHLSRELSEAICQQCHLQGDAQIAVRGHQYDSFRPGLPLEDFRQDYRLNGTKEMTVVGHVEQMQLSECYQQTESLTCSTCHDPHSDYSENEQIVRYREACLSCHQTDSCRELMPLRNAKEDRCSDCHMPVAPTEIPHVPFTHHRIGIHRANANDENGSPSDSRKLINLLTENRLPPVDADRCRGLGWMHMFLMTKGDPQHNLTLAQKNLTRAWNAGARDPAVTSALATLAKEFGRLEESKTWARRTLEQESAPSEERMSALECLSEIEYQQKNFAAALTGYKELTQLRRDARHWFMRGLTEYNLNDSEAALESFLKSSSINPRYAGTHTVLGQLYSEIGDPTKSQFHAERAKLLED